MSTVIYISLLVRSAYNYNASPRLYTVRYACETVAQGKQLMKRLRQLMTNKIIKINTTNTRRWLSDHLGVDGDIKRIDGLFQEETRQLA